MNFDLSASASKLTFAVIGAAICAKLELYAIALLLLAFCLIADYGTGVIKAWKNGNLSSKIGAKGLVTKLCYLIGVAVGFAVDLLIRIAVCGAGIQIETPFVFGLVVTIIFICNELLSITENLTIIGVPMPSVVTSSLQVYKKIFESKKVESEDP